MSEPLYDESRVPAYTLPPLFSAADRAAALRQFAELEYGPLPPPLAPRIELLSERADALDGLATRRELRLHFSGNGTTRTLTVLLYIPNRRPGGRCGAFAMLNFMGNHSKTPEADVQLSHGIGPDGEIVETRSTHLGRWPLKTAMQRNWAMATAFYGELFPDCAGGLPGSIWPLFGATEAGPVRTAISAWAWGLSRIREVLALQPEIDPAKIGAVGHSRLGKTALWAGANDPEFFLTASNDSGCGGAALMRRGFGETVEIITKNFPHWFSPVYASYAGRDGAFPLEQHQLLALIAPRKLAVGSAADDLWADPKGEYLSLRAAAPAWRRSGLAVPEFPEEPPAVGETICGRLGYHRRPGGHNITAEDWNAYFDVAEF